MTNLNFEYQQHKFQKIWHNPAPPSFLDQYNPAPLFSTAIDSTIRNNVSLSDDEFIQKTSPCKYEDNTLINSRKQITAQKNGTAQTHLQHTMPKPTTPLLGKNVSFAGDGRMTSLCSLEALPVDNGWTRLVVFFLFNPHLLESSQ